MRWSEIWGIKVPKRNIVNKEIKQAESAVVDPTEELNPAEQVHKWTLSLDWAVQSPDGRLHFLHIYLSEMQIDFVWEQAFIKF